MTDTGAIEQAAEQLAVGELALVGLIGLHAERFDERVQLGSGLQAEETDVDDVRWWAITPEDLGR